MKSLVSHKPGFFFLVQLTNLARIIARFQTKKSVPLITNLIESVKFVSDENTTKIDGQCVQQGHVDLFVTVKPIEDLFVTVKPIDGVKFRSAI